MSPSLRLSGHLMPGVWIDCGRMHRLDHVHIPHAAHRADRGTEPEKHLKGHRTAAMCWDQPIRHTVGGHRGAETCLEAAPSRQLTHDPDRYRSDHVLCGVTQLVVVEQGAGFHLHKLETPI